MQNNNYNRKKFRGSSPHYEIEHNPSYWETPLSDQTGSLKFTIKNISSTTVPSQLSAEVARWEDDGGESKQVLYD